MKSSKSEVVFFILSLLVLAVGGSVYMIFGNTPTSSTPVQRSSASKEKSRVTHAEALVSALEANPSQDSLTAAQEAVKVLKDSDSKTDLQGRIDAISSEVTNQANAETAVQTAENEQTAASIAAAQASVDLLTNESKKAELQERIDAISTAVTSNYYDDDSATTSDDTTSNYAQTQDYSD